MAALSDADIDAFHARLPAMGAEQNRRRGHDLQRISAALKRIEDGAFGCCVTCGGDIATGRLDIDPAAAPCVRCARNPGFGRQRRRIAAFIGLTRAGM